MKPQRIALLIAVIGFFVFAIMSDRATGDFKPNQDVTIKADVIGGKQYQYVIPSGADGTAGVSLSGTQRTFTAQTLTSGTAATSGTFAAGLKSLDLMVTTGTFNIIGTGTVTLTAGQGFSRTFAPDTSPAISYSMVASSTTAAITTQ